MLGKLDEPPREHFRMSWICALAAILLTLVLLCIICHRKRRRRRRRAVHRSIHVPAVPGTSRQPPLHFCEELGERFASVDSV
ncbi:hypothetical protein NQ317_009804 [Molorchus minor]|uniref:Uncharacterized protein n=1 Tax=Molorchus minor TaxID=1323400 RepID=A0ABQ9JW85_9CUCU|nr:hypothetical protein NQ317_009804 [Molorchus minor]